MILKTVNDNYITPALQILPKNMDSAAARVMLLAIGLQESRLIHTHQIGGPAHGYWQFEKGGGARGVMQHSASRNSAQTLCVRRGVPFELNAVFDALETDQVLAAGFARLLLWTDPRALPTSAQSGWDCYIRNWRPGKPHRQTWDAFYKQAQDFTGGRVG